MSELRFEEKGYWVELEFTDIKHKWDSNENDYRNWPENISRSYASALVDFAKKLPDNKQRLEMFFHAKGIATKGRLFKELFRNMNWPYSKEEIKYIEETKKEAEKFFSTGVLSF